MEIAHSSWESHMMTTSQRFQGDIFTLFGILITTLHSAHILYLTSIKTCNKFYTKKYILVSVSLLDDTRLSLHYCLSFMRRAQVEKSLSDVCLS